MLGLIKKDLFMIKNNYRSILIALIIYVFYSTQFSMNMLFFLPFMGLMICISTISYDDFNNFHLYASSLPYGKCGVVKSKYITTIAVTLLLTIVSLIVDVVTSKYKADYIFFDSLSNLMGSLFAMILLMSVLYPILFKFGAEKGRIAMLSISFFVLCFGMFVTKFINFSISKELINFFNSYYMVIFCVLSVLFIGISYIISKKIYLKKEF